MSEIESKVSAPHANVCLLLEGTFPYVRGGVSTWVKQMIEGMPHLSFSIIYLGADRETQGEPSYELPANVVHLEAHFLLDARSDEEQGSDWMDRMKSTFKSTSKKKAQNEQFLRNSELHGELCNTEKPLDSSVSNEFTDLMTGSKSITETDLKQSRGSWETIREKYNDAPEGLDFNHFFWTVRSMHSPLFTLADIVKNAPSADLYHSVSTGYAGYLGSMLKGATGKPFIISEHGIYTKERELDLAQVDWIPEDLDPFKVGLNDNMNYLRSVWIRFFLSLGRMSYSTASQVFTLYEGNRVRQIKDGCPEEKLSIIPNGVDVKRFRKARRDATADIQPVLALIGRVVPIKDIKNFIRAMQIVRNQLPNAQGWLFGPEDEDEDYTRECKMLVESLGLSEVVKFKGFGKPEEIFPKVGLTVLTSVSEGQPLVVLEGFAAGIPAVTTDVGSCRELIEGIGPEDKSMGTAGSVVPIADPAAFANAAVALLSDTDAWRSASRAAIARVEAYYDEDEMIDRYQHVYEQEIATNSDGHLKDKAA
ncbi:GT4 family glycosyltransferase PelF [Granulosicoccus sp.]|nr:GT4 family glycosyltransferase PelF [Granulosicoccus sp.]MDB4224010.1 GT4 family glycosyltransferase PelF [Granulosicoccus sp.]